MKSLESTFTLNNGVGIPCLGFGTYKAADGEEAYSSVRAALDAGYRHIDTAAVYRNEESVGRAVRESGIPRHEIFVTSKVWNSDQGYDSTLEAFSRTMDRLGLDYLDLYLIHWPRVAGREEQWPELNRETWSAMEKIYDQKHIRALGLSNFKPHHIESLLEVAVIKPAVNQIELHPGLPQHETVSYCKEKEIIIEAWGPFSQGRLFQSDALDAIASKYGKTVAQVCLRWHLQRDILPLPKSVTPSRIVENTRIFDFELTSEDMKAVSSLHQVKGSGMDPDTAAW